MGIRYDVSSDSFDLLKFLRLILLSAALKFSRILKIFNYPLG